MRRPTPQDIRNGKGQDTKVDEALVIHPSNNENPYEEGENIKESIPDVLNRVMSCASYDVNDSGLVEDCINFSDKTEDCKAFSFLCNESSSKADYDYKMMKQEHARLAADEHIYCLCHVNTQGEDN